MKLALYVSRGASGGVAFEDILLLFIIGSVIGCVAETVYCYVVEGKVESRKGVLYGPFCQVYGFGAVLLTTMLSPLATMVPLLLFVFSGLLGGLFEAACSLVEEKVFGTSSWGYSTQRFSFFGGRTSLMYMFFWGVLGSVYIRIIHPFLFFLIGAVPAFIKSPVVLGLSAFLVLDMALSAIAVWRWSKRRRGIAPRSRIERLLDAAYPDKYMRKVYPNMTVVDEAARKKSPAGRIVP